MYRDIQSGPTREVAGKLAELITARKENYRGALFKIVMAKHADDLQPFWAKIELFHNNDGPMVPTKYEYGNAILASYELSSDEVRELLVAISEGRQITTPDKHVLTLQEGNGELIMLGTLTDYGHASHAWPCYFGTFRLLPLGFNLPTSPLVKRGLPPYPNIQTATRDFLGLEARPDQYTSDLRMIIAVPDFRAKITGVTISNKKVNLTIDCKALLPRQIAAKIYMGSGKSAYQPPDMAFDEAKSITWESTFEPEMIHAYILDEQDEIMDAREIDLKSSYYTSDIKIETPSLQVIEMVRRGENEDVEFKEKIGDEFLETFVSFVNTHGGTILLGVDDHCRIVGTDDDIDKLKEKLTARIARNIDPPTMKFALERVVMDEDKSVILIRIFKRERKLYSLYDRGILVRRGSSDRWITSSEVDEIYSRRNDQPYGSVTTY